MECLCERLGFGFENAVWRNNEGGRTRWILVQYLTRYGEIEIPGEIAHMEAAKSIDVRAGYLLLL